MAKTLSNTGIADGSTLFAAQLSQSIEALNGSEDYDITISGSLEVDGPLTLLDLDSATGVSTILVLDGTSVKTQTGGGSGSSGTEITVIFEIEGSSSSEVIVYVLVSSFPELAIVPEVKVSEISKSSTSS